MTVVPHVFTQLEMQKIAVGVTECNKDWKLVSKLYLPHLNPICIKNKYYKMVKNGTLQTILKNHQNKHHECDHRQTPSFSSPSSSDDYVLECLLKVALDAL